LSALLTETLLNCLSVLKELIQKWKVTNLVFGIREVFSKLGYRIVPLSRLLMPILKIVAPGGRVIAVCKLATGHPI